MQSGLLTPSPVSLTVSVHSRSLATGGLLRDHGFMFPFAWLVVARGQVAQAISHLPLGRVGVETPCSGPSCSKALSMFALPTEAGGILICSCGVSLGNSTQGRGDLIRNTSMSLKLRAKRKSQAIEL